MKLPASARPITLRHRPDRLLPVLLAFAAGLVFAAPAPPGDRLLAGLQADCRLEGQAAGLAGSELEQFVEECVADLLSVEIHNLQKD